ncbi:hypothetical protein [Saccharospirillum impatiens]|uniref:hypothetical protein n=1 Tax=Saccharospirillum impatiens TaxID=169438 RepID=UPI000419AAA6|nr:hypothetical protein [Saccharospirillum impatiens]
MKQHLLVSSLFFTISSLAYAETSLINPDWIFQDDFESTEDRSFWGSEAYTDFGVTCPGDNSNGKSLVFNYQADKPDAGNSWSEKRFKLPVDAVQLEMSYDLFVPTDYIRSPRNHKNFVLWSGTYGKFNANISVSSESWPTDGGATPSVYIGEDGNNYGHSLNRLRPHMYTNNSGRWQRVHVFLELATEQGDYGKFEISKDGVFINGTHHPDAKTDSSTDLSNQINYANRGNFIDQGYLMGWVNGGFDTETSFCVDNFEIKVNTSHGETTGGPNLSYAPVLNNVTIQY